MSYINSALRKAQRERDGGHLAPGVSDAALSRNKESGRRRYMIFVIPLAAALSIGLVILAFHGYYRGEKKRSDGSFSRNVQELPPKLKAVAAQPAAFVGREVENQQSAVAKLYDEAFKAQREGRRQEAENLYQMVLSRDPQNIHALNNLGVIQMREKRHDQAVELFVKAIAAKKDYVDPYYNLACLYSQQKNTKASFRYLEQAVKINDKVREWAKEDADFKNVRSLREFKQITEPKK